MLLLFKLQSPHPYLTFFVPFSCLILFSYNLPAINLDGKLHVGSYSCLHFS